MAKSGTLEALWDRYCCRLLAFIRGRIADKTEAEDIHQEVFLRIHRALCCREQRGNLDRWVYRITRNLIIDHYRRHRPRQEIPEDLAAPGEMDMAQADAEARLAFSLREAMNHLPQPYRRALILTEYQGLGQRELAEREGITLSGAKSRVQRARERLRNMLLECCHFELDRRGRVVDHYARCPSCDPHTVN